MWARWGGNDSNFAPTAGPVDEWPLAQELSPALCLDKRDDPHPFSVCSSTCSCWFISLPPASKIALGPHTLKLIVEDLLSNKVAEETLRFTVK